MILTDKTVVVTGGTGSLGRVLVRRLLSAELGRPARVIVFSRDEAKQHEMRLAWQQRQAATDEVIYHGLEQVLQFYVGDVRDPQALSAVLREAQVVFHCAALKQVPTCEYFPYEAVQTNIGGAQNIVQVVRRERLPVECVVGISTDKACLPVNVMGMTKAIQERILIRANYDLPETRFVCVRYGNVLASRGSVLPLFHAQIRQGGPVTITTPEMTRFLLTLDQAADAVFAALQEANRGEVFVPQAPAARILDLAAVLIAGRPIPTQIIGIRPGEKVHETLISEEEGHRTGMRGRFYAIAPILPELRGPLHAPLLGRAYTSADQLLSPPELQELLSRLGLLLDAPAPFAEAWI